MSGALADAYGYCGAALREADKDSWLAALFSPTAARPHLHALWLFAHELGSLRQKIAQPMAGEIRLQYWRDVLNGRDHGETGGNPLALALRDTIEACALPIPPFIALTQARLFDVYDDPMSDMATLEGYCGETSAAVVRLACLILAGGTDPGGAEAAGHAGMALGITGILRDFPHSSNRGQVFLPADVLLRWGVGKQDILARRDMPGLRSALGEMVQIARMHLAKARAAMGLNRSLIAPAFLGLPVAQLYLRQMERRGWDPFAATIAVPQWRRQWAMWRA